MFPVGLGLLVRYLALCLPHARLEGSIDYASEPQQGGELYSVGSVLANSASKDLA